MRWVVVVMCGYDSGQVVVVLFDTKMYNMFDRCEVRSIVLGRLRDNSYDRD